jgi:hypothetical protein
MSDDPLSPGSRDPQPPEHMSAGQAVLLGHLFITLPGLLIFLGFSVLGKLLLSDGWLLFFFIGFVLAWTWWSFTVPRWRRWALNRGAPPDRLQKLAAATGLVWPKGWLPEKTELKLPDSPDSTDDKVLLKRRRRGNH